MYCLDNYALWEINFGNKKFSEFLVSDFVITDWTLTEFYRGLLKKYNKQTADYWFNKLKQNSRQVNISVLIRAAIFQHTNKKTDMSLFDAVGYIFSLENDIKFVTGDKEFKHREGVEFIQK